MNIESGSIIARNKNIPTVEIDGEVAMMNAEKGKYYGMDMVATRIWMLLKEPIRFRTMIDTLTHEYDVEREECEKDVKLFLERLYEEGLVEIK